MANLNVASRYAPDTNTYSDKTWQNLTLAANSAWEEGDDHAACSFYNSALKEAERLLNLAEHGSGPAEAPMIMVISHHNLAEAALRIGQPDVALAHYQTPFDRLLVLASLKSTPADLRQTCIANLKEATTALVVHLQFTGAHVWHVGDIIRKAQFAVASRPAVGVRLS